jgi:archaeosine synthase beta-subunit
MTLQRRDRPLHDPWRYQSFLVEHERAADGSLPLVATIFLTGRECSWRCAMCDLWQSTTVADTPAGAIPHQIAQAWDAIGAQRPAVRQVKLYNASNFFDPRAVPECDYEPIARQMSGISRVIVESHPALVGPPVDRFAAALAGGRSERGGGPTLEVAMGLETAHPDALRRLNKKMTVDDFARAAHALIHRGVAVRTFLLIGAPFVPAAERDEWLVRSVDTALRCGSTAVSLIPTRGTNMALIEPSLASIEQSVERVRREFAGHPARIFVDLWDLGRFAACRACFDVRRNRLAAGNRFQETRRAPYRCVTCGWASEYDAAR